MSTDLSKLLGISPPPKRSQLFSTVIPTIISTVSSVAGILNTSHHVSLAGNANQFGDDQLNVDVAAENAIREALSSAPAIVTVSSEEDPVERSTSSSATQVGERYTLAFDPLDGSSIIAPNWTVGAIYGIWDSDTAVGVNAGEKQIVSILGVFGPRTTAVVAIRIPELPAFCFEVGLTSAGSGTPVRMEILRRDVKLNIAPFKTRYFAPANLRCAAESPAYKSLIDHYIMNNYTLRYAGGLVPDVVHILVKGHGIYVNPVTPGTKAKLRALYELYPMALIMECVGGKALNPADGSRILEGQASGCGDKGAFLFGTSEEVDFAIKKLLTSE